MRRPGLLHFDQLRDLLLERRRSKGFQHDEPEDLQPIGVTTPRRHAKLEIDGRWKVVVHVVSRAGDELADVLQAGFVDAVGYEPARIPHRLAEERVVLVGTDTFLLIALKAVEESMTLMCRAVRNSGIVRAASINAACLNQSV